MESLVHRRSSFACQDVIQIRHLLTSRAPSANLSNVFPFYSIHRVVRSVVTGYTLFLQSQSQFTHLPAPSAAHEALTQTTYVDFAMHLSLLDGLALNCAMAKDASQKATWANDTLAFKGPVGNRLRTPMPWTSAWPGCIYWPDSWLVSWERLISIEAPARVRTMAPRRAGQNCAKYSPPEQPADRHICAHDRCDLPF